jgi:hypothetical protein
MVRRRLLFPMGLALLLAGTLTSCLAVPGDTSKVVKIDGADVDGWHLDYYRNLAYPCSIRGYQTFAIGTRIGSSATANRPLGGEDARRRGAGSRSMNMPVCVTAVGGPACAVHVVTTRANGVNTDPATPTDYQAAILTWVRARLADP